MSDPYSLAPPTPEAAQRLIEEKHAQALARTKLGEFLAHGPLYSPLTLEEKAKGLNSLPKTIELHCAGDCKKVQTFERELSRGESDHDAGSWGKVATYVCRNCGKRRQKYMFTFQEGTFWKVGQTPELREAIDPKLNSALGDSRHLYKR